MNPPASSTVIRCKACTVHLHRMELHRQGVVHALSPNESKLLAYLAERLGVTVSTESLLAEAWGYRAGITSSAVKNTVYRLRKKMERDPKQPEHLISVRGVGYRLDASMDRPDGTVSVRESLNPGPSNLPVPQHPLYGRASIVRRLEKQLGEGGGVTLLSGLGGMGKTRLAIEVGRSVIETLPGGVWFCDLRAVQDRESLVRCLEEGLEADASGVGTDERLERIGEILACRGDVLVILDNAEHLTAILAESIERWCEQAPSTRFLITSREVLGVAGERVEPLLPLSTEEACRLFLDRSIVDLERTPEDETLVQLVEALDGLPLAIELAARWTDLLTPEQLLDRKDERFAYLQRDQEGRHSALKGVIAQSWEHLAPWEQRALSQCAFFTAGFSLDAAEAVVDVSAHPEAPMMARIVRRLVDKSMLYTRTQGGRTRVHFYESVQLFAQQQLPAEEVQDIWTRQGRWYARFGAAAVLDELTLDVKKDALDDLMADVPNLIAIAERLAQDAPELAARCGLAACFGLRRQNRVDEVRRVYRFLRDITLIPELLRARIELACVCVETPQAAIQRLTDLLDEVSESRLSGRILAERASIRLRQFQLESFEQDIHTALPLHVEAGDTRYEATTRGLFGIWHRLNGRHGESEEALNLALLVADAHRRWCHPEILSQLGRTAFQQGHIRTSLRHFEQVVQTFGAGRSGAGVQESIATLHAILGEANASLRAARRMLGLQRKAGDARRVLWAQARLGHALAGVNEEARALALYEDVLSRGPALGMSEDLALVIHYDRASLLVKLGRGNGLENALAVAERCEEKSHTMLSNIRLTVAEAYRNSGQLSEALRWASQSLDGALAKAMRLAMVRAYLIQGLVYAETGQPEAAQKNLDTVAPLIKPMGLGDEAWVSQRLVELREAVKHTVS